jgi:hypothetical protein
MCKLGAFCNADHVLAESFDTIICRTFWLMSFMGKHNQAWLEMGIRMDWIVWIAAQVEIMA